MRLIDANALRDHMYHEAFELDSGLQKWDSGLWIRYQMFESILNTEITIDAEPVEHAHWKKVSGYCTPGGDPVWVCSKCGKGLHVWGIETITYNRDVSDGHQWVACPNCGAKMDEVSE